MAAPKDGPWGGTLAPQTPRTRGPPSLAPTTASEPGPVPLPRPLPPGSSPSPRSCRKRWRTRNNRIASAIRMTSPTYAAGWVRGRRSRRVDTSNARAYRSSVRAGSSASDSHARWRAVDGHARDTATHSATERWRMLFQRSDPNNSISVSGTAEAASAECASGQLEEKARERRSRTARRVEPSGLRTHSYAVPTGARKDGVSAAGPPAPA